MPDASTPPPEWISLETRAFQVRQGPVALPDGRTADHTWVHHPPVIAVVPVQADGRLVLIRQFRPSVRETLIEIPAGTMDRGRESVEECVQREMAEEIGMRARRLVALFAGYLIPGYGNEYMYFFLAEDLYPSRLPPDDDEFIETAIVSREEALAMIAGGSIRDVKTALGILLATAHLGRTAP